MLKGKVTVNLKDLKVLQEDSTKKTVTKGKTLNDTNCGVKKLNKTLLSMKRKRDTRQSSYRNNPKKYKAGTSEDQVFKVCFDESQHMFLFSEPGIPNNYSDHNCVVQQFYISQLLFCISLCTCA